MKIVFITTDAYPLTGGVATYLDQLTQELSKDNEIIIYGRQSGDTPKEFMHNKVKIKEFRMKQLIFGYWTTPEMITEIGKDKPDLIHANHYGFYPAVAAMKASKKYQIPYVYSLYYHPPIYGMFKKLLFWAFYLVYGRATITNAKKVFACSEKEKVMLTKLGAKNVEVVPLIVNKETYPLKQESTDPVKTILYSAQFVWWKGAHQFLGLANTLLAKRTDCRFIFKSSKSNDVILKYLTETYPDRFIYMNEIISESELSKLFQSADIFVSPSYYESFGISNAQALSCGVPVVSTKQGAIPEVVKEGFGLLSDYGDYPKMLEQIEYLLDHPEERLKMGKDASDYVHANYSADKVASKLEETYKTFK